VFPLFSININIGKLGYILEGGKMRLKELKERFEDYKPSKEELLKELKDKQEALAMSRRLGKDANSAKMQQHITEIKSKLAKLK